MTCITNEMVECAAQAHWQADPYISEKCEWWEIEEVLEKGDPVGVRIRDDLRTQMRAALEAVFPQSNVPHPQADPKEPYTVEPDELNHSCKCCGRGQHYLIVGPDGIALGISYADRDDAVEISCMLTDAYRLGQTHICKTVNG